MKRLFYTLLGIAAAPFILFLLLTLLLYCPPVQRWAVGIATHYASEATGKEISIEDVRLSFPLDLQLDGVRVIERNDSLPQKKDTVINAQRAICNVQLRPLFDNKVNINILQLDGVQLNTTNYISDCQVRGTVGRLLVKSHGIDLLRDTLYINKAQLDNANLDICLSDTAKEDTTKSETPWKIRVADLAVSKTRLKVHMPGDTLNVTTNIGSLKAKNGFFDLSSSFYQLEHADLNGTRLQYDDTYTPRLNGLDFNHIDIKDLNIGLDSFLYDNPDISFRVRACNMKEKSGLMLSRLTGGVHIDSTSVHVNNLVVATLTSNINGNIDMDFSAFAEKDPGQMNAKLYAAISREDAMLVIGGSLTREMRKMWPAERSTITGRITGNMQRCSLDNFRFNIPTIAHGKVTGTIMNLTNMDRLKADAELDITTYNNQGSIHGTAHYTARGMVYDANLTIQGLNIARFVPGYGLGRFTGHIKAVGHGTDIFSPATTITADAEIKGFKYGTYDFSNSQASLVLRNGKAHADITTNAKIMNGHVTLDALVHRRKINATVGAELRNVDFYALRMTKAPFSIGVCGHVDIDTDLKDNFKVLGSLSDIRLADSTHVFHPNDIDIDILTRRDTTHAVVNCGDFSLTGDAQGGYKHLLACIDGLTKEANHQVNSRIIDGPQLRKKLPLGHIHLNTGAENPIARFMKMQGFGLSHMYANVTSSPADGINGEITIDTLRTQSLQLDDVNLKFISDAETMSYALDIANGPDNPDYTFKAHADGQLMYGGTTLALTLDDAKGQRGADISLSAMMKDDGIYITLDNEKQIIGYREFTANPDNYIILKRDMRVMADMRLVDAQGTGVQLYSDDENATALQDMTVSIHRLDIASITNVVPYMPKITGVLDGDFHVIINEDNMSISADIDTQKLTYENNKMGDISAELVYMPMEDGTHYLDGIFMKDGEEIAKIEGTYKFGHDDIINADLSLNKMPMDVLNGFIPDQIIGMKGIGTGKLHVEGRVVQPVINGTFDLSQASLISIPYGVELRIDDTPIDIVNSHVVFTDFHLYASNNNPVVFNGTFDFSDFDHMTSNLRFRGEDVQIINAKESRQSEAYGKAFVNIYGRVTGEVSQLHMDMKLDVLPSTNLYYILRDSPITTDNRLKELVTFTDLTAEEPPVIILPKPESIAINMGITINEGSHIVCWLNSNHTNYIDIIGSGDLRMRYMNGDITMNGRYTISKGEMKYSLPVIPLKTFTISSDSYIDFTGDVMNPKLNITATERNRAAVTAPDGKSRAVDFTCGVVISKTLQDMGLQFIISAPEDYELNSELSVLSIEEQGIMAVTMLTTGMYINDNSSNMNVNAALSSFLQQQISNIAGAALKTIDMELGLENTALPDGTLATDYSFKFAKRFWNNRVSVSIGGHISTGEQIAGKTNSFFDNVDVQYRLSDTSNQYVGLFYKHDVYDYLEGYLDQYGVNYTWKRKLQTLKEIFPWVKQSSVVVPQMRKPESIHPDSLVRQTAAPDTLKNQK